MSLDRLRVVAHELRSPVAALVAIAETTAGRANTLSRHETRRLLELAAAALRDVERLVGDATLVSLRRSPVDPGRLVREVTDRASLIGVDVRAEIEPGLPVFEADPQRLRQALYNLVENAAGHSPPGRSVIVSARADGNRVLLAVADRGEGIPAEDQERIFERGVRLTAARAGSGLGLALVRSIAEAHGGSVSVASAPGQGATFTLALPSAGSG